MFTQPVQHRISLEDYLKLDDAGSTRPLEYANGFAVEIEAGSEHHANITSNLSTEVSLRIREMKLSCKRFNEDVRVYLPSTDRYVHPDITVACSPEFKNNTLINSVLIIEVLSPASEDYDKGTKFDGYRSIPTLKEYLTVAQDKAHIDRWTQTNGIWSLVNTYKELNHSLELSLGFSIPLADIYRDVVFSAERSTNS